MAKDELDPGTGELLPKIDALGREIPDPVPMAPPVGYQRHVSLAEQIRQMVRSEALRMAAEQAEADTFEEADDFVVGDDYDPSSPYELDFEGMPLDELKRRKEAHEAELATREAAERRAAAGEPPDPPHAPTGAQEGKVKAKKGARAPVAAPSDDD